MTRRADSSPQTLAVFELLQAEPARWWHGYDIAKATGLRSGTLYPLLVRLADHGLLEAHWESDPPTGRPRRHLYRLTTQGMARTEEACTPLVSAGRNAPDAYRGRVNIEWIEPSAVAEVVRAARADGFEVYVLSTTGESDRQAFFDAVRTGCPLDPPLVSARSWDAMIDSLSGGLLVVDAVRIAIVWSGSAAIRADNPTEFEVALSVLTAVCDRLATAARHRKSVRLYVDH
ncbi:helix-turn-helix transcriptional regulator [Fodinicola feengrottensis]|uniref:helix-turn-helix transcriptional regulator n=1 Tax=Fodinicola feengrottensis TaxID=435914 RepID=UPI0013D21B32|nr:helix-turn-helix transcriptional regulator [Fodinicola feengrottensis]